MYLRTIVATCGLAAFVLAAPAQEPRDLLAQRLKAAQQTYQSYQLLLEKQRIEWGDAKLFEWSKKVLDSELDLAKNAAQRVAAWERHYADAKKWEADAIAAYKAGTLRPDTYHEAQYRRLDAEIGLARAKAKSP
jgi:hypothetical protein